MNRPTRYQVVVGDSLDALEKKVNPLIKVGWIPQGGVCVTVGFDAVGYYQAMCAYNVLGPYITRIPEKESLYEPS